MRHPAQTAPVLGLPNEYSRPRICGSWRGTEHPLGDRADAEPPRSRFARIVISRPRTFDWRGHIDGYPGRLLAAAFSEIFLLGIRPLSKTQTRNLSYGGIK